jgi:glycerophosphoryl diester phosphodiesterase
MIADQIRKNLADAGFKTKVTHRDLAKPVWCTADTLYQDISPEHPREDLSELVRLGVNGIITDVPELLRDILKRSDNRPGDRA